MIQHNESILAKQQLQTSRIQPNKVSASFFVAESDSGCCSSSAAPAAANSAFSARRRSSDALHARGGARKYGPRNVGKGKTTADPLLPRASGGVHGRLRVLTGSQPSDVGKLAFSGPRRPLQQCWRQGRRSTASLHLSGKAKGQLKILCFRTMLAEPKASPSKIGQPASILVGQASPCIASSLFMRFRKSKCSSTLRVVRQQSHKKHLPASVEGKIGDSRSAPLLH